MGDGVRCVQCDMLCGVWCGEVCAVCSGSLFIFCPSFLGGDVIVCVCVSRLFGVSEEARFFLQVGLVVVVLYTRGLFFQVGLWCGGRKGKTP